MKRGFSIFVALAVLIAWLPAHADPSIAAYEKAKPCYTRLTDAAGANAPEKDWRACIDQFEEIYRSYPTGVKAAAALYSSAKLKKGLYDRKKSRADLEGAVKDLNLLVREFPKSSLTDDALYLIGVMRRDDLKEPERAERAFSYLVENYPDSDMATQARVALEKMAPGTAAGSKTKEAVAETQKASLEPTSDASPQAEGMVIESKAQGKQAKAAAEKTAAADKKGKLKADAEAAVMEMSGEAEKPAAIAEGPAVGTGKNSAEPRAKPAAKATAFDRAALEDVKLTQTKGQTKVELVLDKNVEYTIEYTELGPRTKSPATLEISILHAYLKDNVEKKVGVDSPELISYKIGNLLLSSGIKTEFVIAPGANYDIKNKDGVITVNFSSSKGGGAPTLAPVKEKDEKGKKADADVSSLRIVVDPGHGGDDEGAVGPKGTLEKNVTLVLSKEIAKALKDKLGTKVWLTRTSDKTLSLEERHEIALKNKADLFISVHANASKQAKASGIETYYLDNATDEAARKLAERENRSSGKKLSQVEHILSTMLQNYDAAQSRDLAEDVQSKLARRLGGFSGGGVPDRGVRSAMFYVLVGAKCPAILIETAFISNPREEKLLKNEIYGKKLAQAVSEGVAVYLDSREVRPVPL